MIKYMKGDMFATPNITNMAHGCNCAGAMGAGIAVLFKRDFPKMYTKYKELCLHEKFLPGDVYVHPYLRNKKLCFVFNLGTQEHWKTGAKLSYIQDALEKMALIAKSLLIKEIYIPQIGAGLGGLKWDDVHSLIKNVFEDHPTTLNIVNEFISNTPLEEIILS